MSDYVVRVEGIGKKYTIRHGGVYGYTALRDVLSEGAGRLARRIVRRVRVAMVLVVNVAVLVLQSLVHMAMRVPLPHE